MAAKKKDDKRVPAIEWLAAAIGLVIVVGVLGYLLFDAMRTNPSMPPMLSVAPVRMVSDAGPYIVEVEVTNGSRQTAAAVQIDGTLKKGDGEKSSATLDYVPGRSTRRAGLIFKQDPRGSQLDLRVTGYQEP